MIARSLSRACAVLAACCLWSSALVSAQVVGTSLSGPTDADGASPYYNPAAMGAGHGTHLELDGGLVLASLAYQPDLVPSIPVMRQDASHTGATIPLVTLGGFTDAIHPDWRIGLAVTIPRTGGGAWRREDGAGGITRYFAVTAQSVTLAAIPAVSWSPADWISIGLGANLIFARITSELDKDFGAQLNQTAGSTDLNSPLPYGHPDLAAPVNIAGDAFGVGAIGGVFVRPIPELSFGLALHSPVILAGDGTLEVTYPQRLRDFVADALPEAVLPELRARVALDLDVPFNLVAGFSVRPIPMLEFASYYQFEHRSSQPNFNIRVDEATSPSLMDTPRPQAFFDRHRVLLRASLAPIPELLFAAHGVFQTNTVPEETFAPNNFDFDRIEFGLAVRWQIIDELSVMAQYSHIVFLDRVIDTSLHRPLTEPSLAAFNHPTPTGTYSASGDTIRLGVIVRFGAPPRVVEEEPEEGADTGVVAPEGAVDEQEAPLEGTETGTPVGEPSTTQAPEGSSAGTATGEGAGPR